MKAALFALVLTAALLVVGAASAAKPVSGTISGPNEAGPYVYGLSELTFTVESNLKGNPHPMVEVSCYQDVNGDSVVDMSLFGPDLVWLQLDHPNAVFTVGSVFDAGSPAACAARLFAYGWKGGQQSIVLLDEVTFSAGP